MTTQFQWKNGMERSAIIERLTEVMEDVFDLDHIEYRDELSAADIEEWDSLSNIRFIVAVEKAFGVRLTNSEIGGLENVGQLVHLIGDRAPS
jgi:acyl carrier protein